MSSRPLTPPYVPFGIQRFNRLSAIVVDARTVQGSHNTLPVRAFRMLWSETAPGYRQLASIPSVYFPMGRPATPVSPASAGFAPSFSASSNLSRCTCASAFAAIHSSFAGFASCWLHRNSRSIRECRPSRSPSPAGRFCLAFGSLALSISSLPLQGIVRGRGYTRHSRSFPAQSQEI